MSQILAVPYLEVSCTRPITCNCPWTLLWSHKLVQLGSFMAEHLCLFQMLKCLKVLIQNLFFSHNTVHKTYAEYRVLMHHVGH